jgi:hypothetical protein
VTEYRRHANIDIIFANLLDLLAVEQFRALIPAKAVVVQVFLEPRFLEPRLPTCLQRRSTADKPYQDHHHRNDQQNMDKAAKCIGRHQTKQPQNNEHNSDGIKHDNLQ